MAEQIKTSADMETIGDRLWTLRAEHEMKQSVLANELGIAPNTISHAERGTRLPRTDVIIKYSDYFGVSTDWILKGREHGE